MEIKVSNIEIVSFHNANYYYELKISNINFHSRKNSKIATSSLYIISLKLFTYRCVKITYKRHATCIQLDVFIYDNTEKNIIMEKEKLTYFK